MNTKAPEPNSNVEKSVTKDDKTTDKKSAVKDKEIKTTKDKSSKKKATRNKQSVSGIFGIFIGLIALGVAGYSFWILQLQVSANEALTKAQNTLTAQLSQQAKKLQQGESSLEAEVSARESAQAEHQTLDTAMQNVSAKLGRSTVAWRMAEVEYLLTVANHRLILAEDRDTAIKVFVTADERMKAIGDTSLLKVREAVADELLALRSMPKVDISGMVLKVSSLINSVDELPLLDKKRIAIAIDEKPKEAPEDWKDIPLAVWEDLKGLVQVRRHQQPTEPLLPPNQTRHLYQNLTLKLEQARLALLKSDTQLFRQYVSEAENWVAVYFELESPAVKNTISTFKGMSTVELKPAVPDVSNSLRLLREVMQEQATSK